MVLSKKTPLYDEHIKAGGKMVEFAGWLMPIQYEGLRQEHDQVRNKVGLFDVSHMGEIRIKGPQALETVEWLTTNYVGKLEKGEAQYSLLPNENAGIVDDLIVYCLEKDQDYLLCVNAANRAKDLAWIEAHNKGAEIIDESSQWGQIAIQGPQALSLLEKIFPGISQIDSFCFESYDFQGVECLVARTGYTGEDGCEIFVPSGHTATLWQELMLKGQEFDVKPIGLGARDTLRTEMKYSLYGHEINDSTNPFEAGLGWVVKAGKKDFLGKDYLLQVKEEGIKKQLVGFHLLERGIPRQGYKVFSFDNEEIGEVTSGTMSPSLNESIGIAFVASEFAKIGTEFLIEIRAKKIKAKVIATPFVNPRGA